MTNNIRSIHSVEFEGFYYVATNDGVFGKGCKRCGGTGHYSFNGYDSICYACGNVWEGRLGDIFDTEEDAKKWCHGKAVAQARRDRQREAKRLQAVHQMEVNQLALKAADEEVYNFLMNVQIDSVEDNLEKDSFIRTMAEKLRWVAQSKMFTTNMIAAIRRTMERRNERAAEAASHPAPTGRVAVTGEIVSTKIVESEYGTSFKILVKDDAGYKVWCSLPKAQMIEAENEFLEANPEPYTYGYSVWFTGAINDDRLTGVKGRRITFTATLEPSKDDVAFAFGSRPTKGAWL
jgi:hypothetical protein